MEDLKFITASNIINLRTKAGMTQTELAALLSYSDKSVSKWERAEAVPDAYVLKNMSSIFGVTVDYLLSTHDQWEPPKKKSFLSNFQTDMIISITMAGIATLALMLFVIFWLLGNPHWIIFIYSILVSLIALLVLQSVFKKGKHNYFIIGALIFALVAALYFTFLVFFEKNFWQLFILVVPGWVILFLCFLLSRQKNAEK